MRVADARLLPERDGGGLEISFAFTVAKTTGREYYQPAKGDVMIG
ncbi:MAG: hypothetical protein ACI33P_02750 [Lysinibacillus sp.]